MPDESKGAGQTDIDRMLAEASATAAAVEAAAGGHASASSTVDQGSIDSLLDEAQQALAELDEPTAPLPPGVKPFEFRNLVGGNSPADSATLDLLRDVSLDLKIELGRTSMHLDEVLRLKQGAVVTLDKLAGDPVDIYANGRLIARGEVLVLNDNFCVRVSELFAGENGVK